MSVLELSATEARTRFKDVLDAAERGRATSIVRDRTHFAVVDGERLRSALAHLVEADARLVAEAGGWSAFLVGRPISASGSTVEEAIEDLLVAVREYADDFNDRLSGAPNHAANWQFVQLVALSDDDDLREWLVGDAARQLEPSSR
ncbi:Prevent-host-death protein OS=Cellulomonas persica OX=76861 GN=CPE01_24670 PE=4 SV=1 [Cellulomonas persica]